MFDTSSLQQAVHPNRESLAVVFLSLSIVAICDSAGCLMMEGCSFVVSIALFFRLCFFDRAVVTTGLLRVEMLPD